VSDDRQEPGEVFPWGLRPSGASKEPAAEEPPVEQPPVEQPPVEQPPVQDAPPPTPAPVAVPSVPTAPDLEGEPTVAMSLQSAFDEGEPTVAMSMLPTGETDGDETGEHSAIEPIFASRPAAQAAGQAAGPAVAAGRVRASSAETATREPGAPIPKVQRILLWVAGGLLAALAILALFLLGSKLGEAALADAKPTPQPTATATPTPTPTTLPAGPVDPGEYAWDALLGRECIEPFSSAWAETFTVVGCARPHTAQLIGRGVYKASTTDPYPGVEALTTRTAAVCSSSTYLNFGRAKVYTDLQISVAFAATAEEWDAGDRSYFCFVTRASGDTFTKNVAK
jgi:Septum formation